MGIKSEIMKNQIAIESLEDDSLVQLFREIQDTKFRDRAILKKVLRTLLERKKLHLLTNR